MLGPLLSTYLRPYRTWLCGVVVLQFVSTLSELSLFNLNGEIIDNGVALGDPGFILQIGITMLGVSLLKICATVTAVYCAAYVAMGFGRDVRAAMFSHVGSFSSLEVFRFGTPSLITRNTNDVQQVQMLVLAGGTMLAGTPIMMFGGVVMALREDVGLSWLLLVSVPALLVPLGALISRMMPCYRRMQTCVDMVNKTIREQISGIRVVRAFVQERFEARRFEMANRELTDVSLQVGRLMAMMFPLVILVLNFSSVAVLWFGGQRVDAGLVELGSLTAYLGYVINILVAAMMATFILILVPRGAVSAGRILEVLNMESSVVRPAVPVKRFTESSTLRFVNVEYRYPGASESVLRGVNISSRPGQITALIGSTGAGKTTLLSLVPRLFDVSNGGVKVDGVDVRRIEPEVLWNKIGFVPQQSYLFSGTIADNLRYGRPDAQDHELWEALEIAQARDFVEAMTDGLDALIVQGGTNVSGGQRQRLAIARALVRKPKIYLFDDSFSALDLVTDARLRRALRPATETATVLSVAQRVSTVADADQIVVLEEGVVVGMGSHDQLLDECETYQEIVESQLSKDEGV